MIVMVTKIDSYVSGLSDWEDYIGLHLGNMNQFHSMKTGENEYENNAWRSKF